MLKMTVVLTTFGITLAAGLALVIPELVPSAQADSFNAKLSAWELTTTSTSSGTLVPPDVLAKMKPETRAQLEATMKSRAGKPQTHSTRECLTKEDLDQKRLIKEEEESDEEGAPCTTKVLTKSSSRLVLDRTCPPPHPVTAHFTFEAKTPESITGTVDYTRPGSGKVHADIKGRWIGASCEGIEE
ncbi:MAG: DUF3617 domain-containing protein [Nitrospira sp.]|nr:DUF3617 domain-containing protein [Nitrospira sp.]